MKQSVLLRSFIFKLIAHLMGGQGSLDERRQRTNEALQRGCFAEKTFERRDNYSSLIRKKNGTIH